MDTTEATGVRIAFRQVAIISPSFLRTCPARVMVLAIVAISSTEFQPVSGDDLFSIVILVYNAAVGIADDN